MGSDERLYEPRVNPFPTGVEVDGGLRRYEGWVEAKRAGAIGYTVRVVPHHPLLASPAEMGLATLPAALTTAPPDSRRCAKAPARWICYARFTTSRRVARW